MAPSREHTSVVESSDKKSKMKRKRDKSLSKSETAAHNEIPKKQIKTDFTEIEFKVMIKDPNTTFAALEKFLDQAKLYPDESKFDIVAKYCQTSGECAEIVGLLDGQKRKPSETYLIFSALECILMRAADDLAKYKPVARNVSRQVLTAHLGAIYSMLAMKNKSSHIKSALKLLVAMVMQGTSSAREVQAQFDFRHYNIAPLFNRRDLKDPQDVRTCLIQFLISFLVAGDNAVVLHLVNIKGLLNSVFPGLSADKLSTIELFLPVLLEKVVLNAAVNKTTKMHIFNEKALKEIGRLYSWIGSSRWQQLQAPQAGKRRDAKGQSDMDVTFEAQEVTEDQHAVHAVVHAFLTQVCCSFKHGLNFYDRTFGTANKNMNQILTNFLTSLPKPHTRPLVDELVIKVLQACPDQLRWYLPSLKTSCVPRASTPWLQCMKFLAAIYEAQPDICVAWQQKQTLPVDKLVAMAMSTLIPPRDIWTHIIASLKKTSLLVRHNGLQVALLVLKKAESSLAYCVKQQQNSNSPHWRDLIIAFQNAVAKALPSPQLVLSCWTSAVCPPSADKDVDTEAELGLPLVDTVEHLQLILRLLCAYRSVAPANMRDHVLDFAGLLEGTRTACSSCDQPERLAELQVDLLELLSGSDAHQIAWMKESSSGRSTVHLLLEMVMTTSDQTLCDSTKKLVQKLLMGMGIFDDNEEELSIWLDSLVLAPTEARQETRDFVERIIATVLRDPYEYAEQVLHLVSDAMEERSCHGNLETASIVTTDDMIDAILSLDDLELGEEEEGKPGEVAAAPRLPLSPLVTAAMETVAKETTCSEVVRQFLEGVLRRVARVQLDPLPLCLLVHAHMKTHPALWGDNPRLTPLIHRWLPPRLTKGLVPPPALTSSDLLKLSFSDASGLLEECFEAGPDVLSNKKVVDLILTHVARVDTEETCLLLARQVLLYLRTEVSNAKLNRESLMKVVEVYFDALEKVISCLGPPTEGSGAVELVYRTVLCHPTIKTYFLSLPEMDVLTKKKNLKRDEFISQVVTTHMSRLVKQIPRVVCVKLSDVLVDYVDRLQMYMVAVFDTERSGKMSDKSAIALEALDGFLICVNGDVLVHLVEWFLTLPLDVLAGGDEPGSLTPCGRALTSCLGRLCHLVSNCDINQPELSHGSVKKLFKLSVHISCDTVNELLNRFLHVLPLYSVCVECDTFTMYLNGADEVQLEIIATALAHSATCRRWFARWGTGSGKKMWKLRKDRVKYLRVVREYLRNETHGQRHTEMLETIGGGNFWKDLSRWICTSHEEASGAEENDSAAVRLEVLELLSGRVMETEVVTDLWKKLDLIICGAVPPTLIQATFYTYLTNWLDKNEESAEYKRQQMLACMKALVCSVQNKEKRNKKLEEYLIEHGTRAAQEAPLEHAIFDKLVAGSWVQFIKCGLRAHYCNPRFLDWLCHLVVVICNDLGKTSEVVKSLSLTTLHQMILSHSQFLRIMLADAEAEKSDKTRKDSEVKGSLVKLLLTIVQGDHQCCQTSHLTVLFGAYGATLSETDQRLLILLRLYEASGCKMQDYRPYMWGPEAVERYTVMKNLGPSLWQEPTMEQVVGLLEPEQLWQTVLHFPLRRSLKVADAETVMAPDKLGSLARCYDPCFLMPLFGHLVAPDRLVNCRKFVEQGCLSVTLAALSSHDPAMRGAACYVLHQFGLHLETERRFPERLQVVYLLESVRNSLETENLKFACVISVFLAKAARLMLKWDDHMYQMVNAFLLLKPSIDTLNVPEFYKLFNSATVEFKTERAWLLALLSDGLRETADYRIFAKRYTFKLLLGFHDSVVSDAYTKRQVLAVVQKACSIKTVALDLVKNHGLLAWISGTVSHSATDVGTLMRILHDLWFTLLGDRDAREGKVKGHTSEEQLKSCLPPAFTSNMLSTMLNLLRHYRDQPTTATVSQCTHCLASMLSHQRKTTNCLSATSPGHHGVAVTTPTIRDFLLLVWHVSSLMQEVATSQDVLALLNVSGHSKITSRPDRDTKMPAQTESEKESENSDLAASIAAEQVEGICRDVLHIAGFVRPDTTASTSCLFVFNWCLNQATRRFHNDLDMCVPLLTWIKDTVVTSDTLRQQLLGETAESKDILKQLLRMYAVVSVPKYLSLETVEKSRQAVNKLLNETFLSIFDEATSIAKITTEKSIVGKISGLLKRKSFKTAFSSLTGRFGSRDTVDEDELNEVLRLLVIETWLGAESPLHFTEGIK